MSVTIHPSSLVDAKAELSDGVEIGPFCVVVSMGHPPQDFKHKGGPVRIEIGERSVFRENVNIHPGVDVGEPVTRIGNDCYFMVGTLARMPLLAVWRR